MPDELPTRSRHIASEDPADHQEHRIKYHGVDMGGRDVVICVTCNARLRPDADEARAMEQWRLRNA